MVGEWWDPRTDEVWTYDEPPLQVDVTDNEVVAELLDAKGNVIAQVLEREPIGYRIRRA